MRRSRLSQYKQHKLIELFVAGITARTAPFLFAIYPTISTACTTPLRWLSCSKMRAK